jgi:hypothetical protein
LTDYGWRILKDETSRIERLTDHWGDLCANKGLANKWADELVGLVRSSFTDQGPRSFFHGTSACFSALLKAGRNEEVLELLNLDRHCMWYQFGARALVNLGRRAEAIRFVERCGHSRGEQSFAAGICEQLLLEDNQIEEAYRRYALRTDQQSSYIGTYRAIAKKYPTIEPQRILNDLIQRSPGEEGKWFATAKQLGMLDLAAQLAVKSPCDPKTLMRACRDYLDKDPGFALTIGLAAIHWLLKGYGYEVEGADVWAIYECTMRAAEKVGREEETGGSIAASVKSGLSEKSWAAKVLASKIGGLST